MLIRMFTLSGDSRPLNGNDDDSRVLREERWWLATPLPSSASMNRHSQPQVGNLPDLILHEDKVTDMHYCLIKTEDNYLKDN